MSKLKKTPATTKPTVAAAAADPIGRTTVFKDDRRTLPTEDLVSKVKKADLVTVAATQRISASHFYEGLVRLRNDFLGAVLLPPPRRVLPLNLIGALLLRDFTPARDISVSVRPIPRKGTTPIVIEKVALTDAGGQFALREIGTLEVD